MIYTVHAPKDAAHKPERIVFVRDGFSWAAAIFGALWLLWHRLWLALLGYLAVTLSAAYAMKMLGVPNGANAVITLLIALLMGLEGPSLRRWTLSRRNWRMLDVIAADSRDAAESRFFDRWRAGVTREPPRPATDWRPPPPSSGIVGLFPESQR